MKMNAYVVGVGMTRFAKYLDRGLKSIGAEAIQAAIADAGIEAKDIQAAWMANAAAGVVTGQESIRGEVILRGMGIGSIPVVNVENACASASTALHQACAMVSAGLYDVVLAAGVEKLYNEDKKKSFAAFSGAVDVEQMLAILQGLKASAAASGTATDAGAGQSRSLFMDIYAAAARFHTERYGTTARQFAAVSAKNSLHGSLNARAQFTEALTIEDVLRAPMIAPPLTRPMCSPIGDGGAAVIVVSEKFIRQRGLHGKRVKVLASALRSGWDREADDPKVADAAAQEAYRDAGIGPQDLSIVELHDASAPAELIAYEELGLCAKGEGGRLVDSGATRLGGQLPVNTSGGLLRKGHPIGATGLAQIVELAEQLQGRSGKRQVDGARFGLAHNGGGTIGTDAAAMCVSILAAS
jgi:acetyl-CoA acetyltransferase